MAQWVELQELVTVIIPSNPGLITQPQEHWIDTQGFNIADVTVEVYGYIGPATAAALAIQIESGTNLAGAPIKDTAGTVSTGGRSSTWLITKTIALSGAGAANAQLVFCARTQFDATGTTGPLQRYLRWSATNSDAGVATLCFRIHLLLHNQ